ncbi:MAG TPA: exodeoxyribonuclease VII large subunit [Thermoanaerobaculia bacterium]|jgi:exodeoxyribonuclease VII large subunit|nr:exodeoxyribonuclease VII large subunit [Thermoanaerobaculia bacterium]
MAERVWKVSELIRQINVELFRYNDISVEGEATNVVRSAAGHIYFSIKDSRAQMRVVLFATNSRFLRFRIENGLQLVVRGRLTLYEQKGEFQLNAVAVEPAGLGAQQLAFEQLKKQLADEGLFDPARKKPIPMLPQRIAIVTSPTGAAIRDVLNVLGRRFEGLHVQVYPVRVQGRDAAREITIAIRHLSRWQLHDVVLICRGGGSLEDLWAFNEESVARAVAACSIPTISAIGHETDFTICDFVADLRAPTPSAAAEIVIRAKSEICTQIDHMSRRVRHVVESRIRNYRHELRHLASSDRLGLLPRRIASRRERLDRSRVTLFRMLEARARSMRTRLAAVNAPLLRFPAQVARERERLRSTAATLGAVSPLSVLSRGYAIAFSRTKRGKRKPILDVNAVAVGEPIEVQLKKGRLACTVDGKTIGLETVWPESPRIGDSDAQKGDAESR